MSNIKNRKESGFTIIEVLIVLAIAGLIMLIVFLAVPALQRNSRNTQIKNDAANVAGALSEYLSNNAGSMPLPANITKSGNAVTVGATSAAQASAKINGSVAFTASAAAPTGNLDANSIHVTVGRTCSAANTRAAAVYYSIETSGGTANQCIDN